MAETPASRNRPLNAEDMKAEQAEDMNRGYRQKVPPC
jgi:hypothetical protein